jgi:DNA-binding NtrC family response regulator
LAINSVLFLASKESSPSRLPELLQTANFSFSEVTSINHAQEELLSKKHGVLVYRYHTASSEQTLELFPFIVKHNIPVKVILISRTAGVEDAVRFMKAGASDFLVGDPPESRIVESIVRCVNQFKQQGMEAGGSTTPSYADSETSLVGQSPAICGIRSAINLVAKSQTPVLITGESGTGKEVIARLIHLQSNRMDKPLVAVNCAALPRDVIENELFGHERGAFTGALIKKAGCFELADKGTLFFDEIAEMSSETQAKLLRAIELQRFRRLGGKEEVNVDVRTIAATNRNVSGALKSREFREDLYYRLSVIEIYIPPLRERKEDIPLLVEHFLSFFSEKYGKPRQEFSDECLEMLIAYEWPGNVRELKNVVERSVVICQNEVIGPESLPERLSPQQPVRSHITIPVGSSTHEAERLLILQTLASVGNNKSKAARILGLSRKTLHNKLLSFTQP